MLDPDHGRIVAVDLGVQPLAFVRKLQHLVLRAAAVRRHTQAGQVPADQREGIRWRRDGQGAGLPGSYVRHQRPRTFDRWSTWTVGDAAGLGHFDRYLLAPLEGALHGRRLRWTVRRRQPASGGECLLAGLEDRARRPLAAIRSRFRRRARRLRRPALVWGADDPED